MHSDESVALNACPRERVSDYDKLFVKYLLIVIVYCSLIVHKSLIQLGASFLLPCLRQDL